MFRDWDEDLPGKGSWPGPRHWVMRIEREAGKRWAWGSQPAADSHPLLSQCNVGWAGNGNVCGPDTDIDGYPDQALPCMDNNKHCKQVQLQLLAAA